MKKLAAILKGKLEDKKIENKVKRVEIALNSIEINFKSQKDDNEIKLDELLERFNDSDVNTEDNITEISETLDLIEEAKLGIKRVEEMRTLFFSEVETD